MLYVILAMQSICLLSSKLMRVAVVLWWGCHGEYATILSLSLGKHLGVAFESYQFIYSSLAYCNISCGGVYPSHAPQINGMKAGDDAATIGIG